MVQSRVSVRYLWPYMTSLCICSYWRGRRGESFGPASASCANNQLCFLGYIVREYITLFKQQVAFIWSVWAS